MSKSPNLLKSLIPHKKFKDSWNLLHTQSDWTNSNQKKDILFVRGEFWKAVNEKHFQKIANKYIIIGLSSYQCFPNIIKNPFENRGPTRNEQRFINKYGHLVVAWFHCFRDPENYDIPPHIPIIFSSESDFTSSSYILKYYKPDKKHYDFICSILLGDWNKFIRRYDYAVKWLNYMATHMKLKILVIGSQFQRDFVSQITVKPKMRQPHFFQYMNMSKHLIVFSEQDASPRIITEALWLDIPVLVNKNILGGWRYINQETGGFLDPVQEIEPQIKTFMEKPYQPQKWVQEHLNHDQLSDSICQQLNPIFQLDWSQFIDGVVYINLDNRPDRKRSILHQLQAHDISNDLIHRMPAILHQRCGHLGCTRSHIKTFELIQEKGWKRVMVLEDDFSWYVPKQRALLMIKTFLETYKNDWDVFMLAYVCNKMDKDTLLPDLVRQSQNATTTSGYIVNSEYLPKLLENFREGETLLDTEVKEFQQTKRGRLFLTNNACDKYWKRLQETDRFYLTQPLIGKQIGIQSSIMRHRP